MKLTDPENIQESEKEFIDTINAELDWEAIEHMLLEKHNFTLQDEIDYKHGDLVVYDNEIAYKFDFEIRVPLSLIFNRQGDCLKISTLRDEFMADDNTLSYAHSNSDSLTHTLQQNCTSTLQWFNINQMEANPSKLLAISFGKRGTRDITNSL